MGCRLSLVVLCLLGVACSKSTAKKPAAQEAAGEPPAAVVEEAAAVEEATEEEKEDQAMPAPVTYVLSADQQAAVFESPVQTLAGEDTTLASFKGKPLLIVNVASECGLTPQYEQLQALQERYASKGFSVIGFPSNQFNGEEPGTPEEILAFGKENYGVTFPLMQKVDTNGANRHPIYRALTQIKDGAGKAGDVEWNFEKFFVSADGAHITRIRPEQLPTDPAVIELIEAEL